MQLASQNENSAAIISAPATVEGGGSFADPVQNSGSQEVGMSSLDIDQLSVHRPAIVAFVTRMVADPALGEDLTQETFIRASRSIDKLRDAKSSRSWLHSIALNLVRDNFRVQQRTPTSTSDEAVIEQLVDRSESQEEGVLKKEMGECIGRHLQTLPQLQYDVLVLHDMAGLNHSEIANQLDLSLANTRVILHRGRAAFQKILEKNCVLTLGKDSIPCEPTK